ncbi:MAG TPA: hypothetical protein VLX56_02795 [Nitrososphaerales archaeon]|nr:hypothetical protein [Nitrososphaerales archaeon]
MPMDDSERKRMLAIRRVKIAGPALFALGFLFYSAITVFPLAGMPAPPLSPFAGLGSLVEWLGIACASGGLFALFGVLVIAIAASPGD